MLFASIDIGSNAVRLLFSNVFIKNNKPYAEKASLIRIPLRLGEEVFKTNQISDKKANELLKTITAFGLLIDVYKPLKYAACATAAMREAENSSEVVKMIKKKSGIDIRIISGLEEAMIITASNNINVSDSFNYKMYIDVGGGSTEISILKGHEVVQSRSFNIGTIRMLHQKVNEDEWDNMKQWLKKFRGDFGKFYIIGSGGNINKIAKIYGKSDERIVQYDELARAYSHLSGFNIQERIEQLGLRPDRADVIEPAAKIFLSIMKWVRADFIFVPKIGLSDGMIYNLYREYNN